MKKKTTQTYLCRMAAAILFLCFSAGCGFADEQPEQTNGSFTMEDSVSYDGRYLAKQEVEEAVEEGVRYVRVDIFDTETDALSASFYAARASDFWGICWEKDSYRIWIQSADTGICCYQYEDGVWYRDENAERPDYIKSKWE